MGQRKFFSWRSHLPEIPIGRRLTLVEVSREIFLFDSARHLFHDASGHQAQIVPEGPFLCNSVNLGLRLSQPLSSITAVCAKCVFE